MASDDQAKILEDAKKLPWAERVAHKSWFVRAAAYEDIGAACKKALDPEDAIFAETGPLLAKSVGDTNANGMDKALEALLLFLENTSEAQAARIAGPACSNIGAKVLKGRPGTVRKATDVCLAFVEWEHVDEVLEPLFKAFGDKVPKVVVAALDIVSQAFSLFGPKVVKPQPIAKALPALFDARQEPVREGVKKLAVQFGAWLGSEYVQGTLCAKMPDLMRKDVEKLLEDLPAARKLPERFTRKEQAARREAEATTAAADSDGQAGGAVVAAASAAEPVSEEVDSYEFAEPVDLVAALDRSFWEGLSAVKWSERRDALQRVKGIASAPRLAPGDHGDLLRELKKIIVKDSNVVCVGEAIGCVGALAKSLRSDFASPARSLFGVILEKYKDPKTSISNAVTEALGRIHKFCLPLSDLSDDFAAAMTHKNPKIRADAARLLQACVDASAAKDASKVHSSLLPVAAKAANDPTPDVREAGMGVLVAFAVRAGNLGLLDKVSDGFEDSRKKRLQELAAERTGGGKAVVTRAAVTKPVPAAKSEAAVPPKAVSAAGGRAAAARPAAAKAAPRKAGAGPAAATTVNPKVGDDDDVALAGGTLSEAEAKEKLQAFLGDEQYTALQDAQWKARLGAMEAMLEKVATLEGSDADVASGLIQGLANLPGWAEKNFQVLGKAFEVVTQLVITCGISKRDAFTAIGGLVEKVADIKLKGPAAEALFAISETLGPQFTCTQLHKKAAAHKNPKILSESLMWMAKAADEFGLAALNVQQLIEWIKADLGSTNAPVRNAATHLAATCHKQLGTGLSAMLRSDVKPALMTALEEAFRANPQQQVVPTRKVKSAKPKAAGPVKGCAAAAESADESGGTFDPDALLPRVDISGQVGGKVIAALGSANWKERNHTMEDLENIIRTAHRIQPTVGDLIPALKARLTDSNKNLVARALNLFGELAKAMGPAWERVGRPVLQQVVTFLADNKKQVRDAAVGALDAWIGAVPAERVLPVATDFLATPRASAEGKTTGLRWLAGIVRAGSASRALDVVLKAAAVGAADKAVEVREAAAALAATAAEVHSAESAAALETLSGDTRAVAATLLGKAPPPPAAAAAPKAPPPAVEPANAGSRIARAPAKLSPLRTSHSRIDSRENSAPNTPMLDAPCLAYSSKKEERLRKGRFKSSKFEVPRGYEVEELEDELTPLVSDAFRRLLFAKDFKRHMEAADVLLTQLPGLSREIMSCMDLLLRWLALRICEANTQCLLKVLDVTKALLELMVDQEYQLADAEAHTILPCLIEKSGHNQDRIRQYHRELIRLAGGLVSMPRLVEYLMQGLASKNNRTRVDCVDLLGELLEECGLSSCARFKLKPVAAMGQLVAERDKALRSAVLGALEILAHREGEAAVWAAIGNVSSQQRSLIEERFKHAARSQPRRGAADAGDAMQPPSPAELPRLGAAIGRPRSRAPSIAESAPSPRLQHQATALSSTPSIEEAVFSGRGHIQEPSTPQAGGGVSHPTAFSTPMPSNSPGAEPSPEPPAAQDEEELHETFTAATLKLTDPDLNECVEGAKSLCYVLQHVGEGHASPAFTEFLRQSAVELITALTAKTDQVFDWVLDEAERTNQPANSRPCKYVVNALMITFELPCISRAVPMQQLLDLMFVLLARLLDPRVHTWLAHNPNILRGLNVAMFKILGNNFGNETFEGLIQLLMVPPIKLQERGISPPDFERLITKCLVKSTKMLPEKIEQLDVSRFLLVVHDYFTSLGVDEIRRRGAQDEKSLRMVKTLVHELCKCLGEGIREHLAGIPRDADPIPIIHVYVDLHLETLQSAGVIPSAPNTARSQAAPDLQDVAAHHRRGLSLQSQHSRVSSLGSAPGLQTLRTSREQKSGAREVMLPILQKIGVSETSEQGLEELYNFKKDNPGLDTAPYLARLSKEFSAFVEKGLQRLERRERGGAARLSVTSLDSFGEPSGPTSDAAMQALGSRLGALRVSGAGGLDKSADYPPTLHDVEHLQERMRSLRRLSRE